ncbi:MAG: hypothetical protein KJ607_05155, partial [Bacteroidetes bacterium]|nr:hypothetical protein [Bacteroidota bacterium]
GSTLAYNPTKIIVRKKDSLNTLNVQNVNDKEKYITGMYDLEILTLPRMYLYDIEVKQSHTTTVQIPNNGTLTIQKSAVYIGSIYKDDEGKLEWVCNIDEETLRETIMLLPGNYRIIFRSKHATQCINTLQKSFRVTAGGSELLRL